MCVAALGTSGAEQQRRSARQPQATTVQDFLSSSRKSVHQHPFSFNDAMDPRPPVQDDSEQKAPRSTVFLSCSLVDGSARHPYIPTLFITYVTELHFVFFSAYK